MRVEGKFDFNTKEGKRAYQREWNKLNRDKVNASNKRAYAKRLDSIKATVNRHRLKVKALEREERVFSHIKLAKVRERAVARGWEFDLTPIDVPIPDVCPALGIPLDWSDRNHTPSIDRIDPAKGYIRGNVVVVSMKANAAKSDLRGIDLRRMADFYEGLEKNASTRA